MSSTGKAEAETHSKRALAAGMAGNVIEWYDFTLYAYMAVIIADLFFPHHDRIASVLATFGVFAAGYFMRPLGGLVFGWLGDTLGRKPVLLISVLMMAGSSLLLGLLPTFADWGIWASAALVLLRLLQGLSVGGEFSGSVTYLAETAPPGKRGFATSFANTGGVVGMLLGAGVPALVIWLLGREETLAWGWRIPFLLGGAIGFFALLLRRGLPKALSEEESAKAREGAHPIKRLLRDEPGVALKVMLFCIGYGLLFFVPMVYLPTWLALYTSLSLHKALFFASLALIPQLILIPLLGRASDRLIRRTHLLALGAVVMAAALIPLYALAGGGRVWQVALVTFTFSALITMILGSAPAAISEAFDRWHRLTGYALSFNLGIAIGGGLAPLLGTWLISLTGDRLAAAYLGASGGLICLTSILSLKDRSREPLR